MGLGHILRTIGTFAGALAGLALAQPAAAQDWQQRFDTALGTERRAPQAYRPDTADALALRIAQIAEGSRGRIGVAAIDLASGREVAILGDQRFPMASTSKIAIAATFMEGVERGRWSLSSEFPLMVPVSSRAFSTQVAPVRAGQYLPATQLIELMLTRSSNQATDALLKAVGGPSAVNDWVVRAGITEFTLTRDIATLVRDDGEIDPAANIDVRDSATPKAMVQLLAGLHRGDFLADSSRRLILATMERCRTGTRRIPALLPDSATVRHKTGSLNNTSSDVGIVRLPDGRDVALAIYVTGQGSRPNREARIASIARALYDGYTAIPARAYASAGAGYGGT